MTAVRRLRAFYERLEHAYDLWDRLGFPWKMAWKRAGTWQ